MRVDENIALAIEKYLRDNNSTAKELCQKLGISEPAFIKWRRPGKGILQRNWIAIFPVIKKYLPKERLYIDENGEEQYSSMLEGSGNNSYFHPRYIPQMVPLVTLEQLKNFPNIVQTIEQYAISLNLQRIEYRPRTQGCGSGVFAVNVDFDNNVIPNGALLFSSTEVRAKSDCPVLFSDKDGKLNIGKYKIIADKYSIEYNNERIGGSLSKIQEKINWIFPVLYYEVVTF